MDIIAISTAAISLLDNFSKLMPILDRMKAEGRTTFTAAEWAAVNTALDKSQAAATAAISTL